MADYNHDKWCWENGVIKGTPEYNELMHGQSETLKQEPPVSNLCDQDIVFVVYGWLEDDDSHEFWLEKVFSNLQKAEQFAQRLSDTRRLPKPVYTVEPLKFDQGTL